MQKARVIKRKFYNKWLYKVSLLCPGVTLYRVKSYQECIDWLVDANNNIFPPSSTYSRALRNKDDLSALTSYLLSKDPVLYTKRLERNIIDLYTNDQELYNEISVNFENITINRYEPESSQLELLKSNNYIIVKKYPYKKYRYKVFLLPHKLKNNREAKEKYLSWLDTQQDRVMISSAVKDWFIKTDWNWDRRYMYVEDEMTLLMIKMRSSEVLGRIYEYHIIDK
jgi:hypothetical protein